MRRLLINACARQSHSFFTLSRIFRAGQSHSGNSSGTASSWESPDLYARLGIADIPPSDVDETLIKKRHRELVMQYHPDSPNAPPHAVAAFQNIQQAYEVLSDKHSKEYYDRMGAEYFHKHAPQFKDQARRVATFRILGSGVPVFMFLCILLYVFVLRHNSKRLTKTFFLHLLTIWLVVQFTPRILAVGILFALHSTQLTRIAELERQAKAAIVATKEGKELPLRLRVEGLGEDDVKHARLAVTITPKRGGPNDGQEPVATTLTFDTGVVDVSLPGELIAVVIGVKVVDEKSKLLAACASFEL
jgi:hypothetical protein